MTTAQTRLTHILDADEIRILLDALLTHRPRSTSDWTLAGAAARRLKDLRSKRALLSEARLVRETVEFAIYDLPGAARGLLVHDRLKGEIHRTDIKDPEDDQAIARVLSATS